MKILIFNWRDIKNPQAGGSEIYFHEIAKRWAEKGNKVTWITSCWRGCKKEEIVDGIRIIRAGGRFSVYLLAPFACIKEKPDIIIDVENGIPFFTPLFTRRKKILHIHHMHRRVWFKELPWPLATSGWLLETKIMPLVYRNSNTITISKSSSDEIKQAGFSKTPEIVNPGASMQGHKKFQKSKKPSVLFLNRIKKYKGIGVLLKAIKALKASRVEPEVLIAGIGDDLRRMKEYALQNNLANVKFIGKISEEKKAELMQKAWIFVNPSFKEGWGIVNIEANYFGTVVIGSDVCGIKDSIVNGKTGLLFEYGNYKELAGKILLLIKDEKLRAKMEKEAVKWAKKFSWDKSAKEYLNALKEVAK